MEGDKSDVVKIRHSEILIPFFSSMQNMHFLEKEYDN